MIVLVPTGAVGGDAQALARRRPSLAGARVGLLDNSKPNASVLLGRLGDLLVGRAGASAVRRWTKPGSARAATNVEEIAAAVDVVLTGSAD